MVDEDTQIVIGTNPPAGTVAPRGSTVNLLLHDGPVSTNVEPFDDRAIATRRQRWIGVSTAANLLSLQGRTWYFTVTIQQIGRLDCKLIEEDCRINSLSDVERRVAPETSREFDHMALASLWVLGAFQILYTLDKTMKRDRVRFKGLQNQIADVRRKFVRLRGPLAKGQGEDGDFPFPHHAVRISGSSCWAVNPGTLISRIELSNQFLALLTAIAAHPGASR
jgi:hypothetical protein